jgi:hypothetical protein
MQDIHTKSIESLKSDPKKSLFAIFTSKDIYKLIYLSLYGGNVLIF